MHSIWLYKKNSTPQLNEGNSDWRKCKLRSNPGHSGYLRFKKNAEANSKDWKTARKHRRRKGKGTNGPGLQVAGVCDALDGKSNFNAGVAQPLPQALGRSFARSYLNPKLVGPLWWV